MFESDVIRQVLLALTGLVFILLALRTLITPLKVADELGYSLNGVNGYSEIFAIYFGLWLVSGALALFAAARIEDALLGDFVALLVLAQPLGRLVGAMRYGMPQGALLGFFALEVIGGVLLLLVRPAG